MSLFLDLVDRVLSHEGGYVNDPNDPGGETKWGISKRSYPHLDIAALTLEDAQEIYRRDYWYALNLNAQPWPKALCLFDCAVNMGRGVALELYQQPERGSFTSRRREFCDTATCGTGVCTAVAGYGGRCASPSRHRRVTYD